MPSRAYLDTIRFRRQDLQVGMQPILQMISDPRLIGRIHELYPPEPNARPLGVAPQITGQRRNMITSRLQQFIASMIRNTELYVMDGDSSHLHEIANAYQRVLSAFGLQMHEMQLPMVRDAQGNMRLQSIQEVIDQNIARVSAQRGHSIQNQNLFEQFRLNPNIKAVKEDVQHLAKQLAHSDLVSRYSQLQQGFRDAYLRQANNASLSFTDNLTAYELGSASVHVDDVQIRPEIRQLIYPVKPAENESKPKARPQRLSAFKAEQLAKFKKELMQRENLDKDAMYTLRDFLRNTLKVDKVTEEFELSQFEATLQAELTATRLEIEAAQREGRQPRVEMRPEQWEAIVQYPEDEEQEAEQQEVLKPDPLRRNGWQAQPRQIPVHQPVIVAQPNYLASQMEEENSDEVPELVPMEQADEQMQPPDNQDVPQANQANIAPAQQVVINPAREPVNNLAGREPARVFVEPRNREFDMNDDPELIKPPVEQEGGVSTQVLMDLFTSIANVFADTQNAPPGGNTPQAQRPVSIDQNMGIQLVQGSNEIMDFMVREAAFEAIPYSRPRRVVNQPAQSPRVREYNSRQVNSQDLIAPTVHRIKYPGQLNMGDFLMSTYADTIQGNVFRLVDSEANAMRVLQYLRSTHMTINRNAQQYDNTVQSMQGIDQLELFSNQDLLNIGNFLLTIGKAKVGQRMNFVVQSDFDLVNARPFITFFQEQPDSTVWFYSPATSSILTTSEDILSGVIEYSNANMDFFYDYAPRIYSNVELVAYMVYSNSRVPRNMRRTSTQLQRTMQMIYQYGSIHQIQAFISLHELYGPNMLPVPPIYDENQFNLQVLLTDGAHIDISQTGRVTHGHAYAPANMANMIGQQFDANDVHQNVEQRAADRQRLKGGFSKQAHQQRVKVAEMVSNGLVSRGYEFFPNQEMRALEGSERVPGMFDGLGSYVGPELESLYDSPTIFNPDTLATVIHSVNVIMDTQTTNFYPARLGDNMETDVINMRLADAATLVIGTVGARFATRAFRMLRGYYNDVVAVAREQLRNAQTHSVRQQYEEMIQNAGLLARALEYGVRSNLDNLPNPLAAHQILEQLQNDRAMEILGAGDEFNRLDEQYNDFLDERIEQLDEEGYAQYVLSIPRIERLEFEANRAAQEADIQAARMERDAEEMGMQNAMERGYRRGKGDKIGIRAFAIQQTELHLDQIKKVVKTVRELEDEIQKAAQSGLAAEEGTSALKEAIRDLKIEKRMMNRLVNRELAQILEDDQVPEEIKRRLIANSDDPEEIARLREIRVANMRTQLRRAMESAQYEQMEFDELYDMKFDELMGRWQREQRIMQRMNKDMEITREQLVELYQLEAAAYAREMLRLYAVQDKNLKKKDISLIGEQLNAQEVSSRARRGLPIHVPPAGMIQPAVAGQVNNLLREQMQQIRRERERVQNAAEQSEQARVDEQARIDEPMAQQDQEDSNGGLGYIDDDADSIVVQDAINDARNQILIKRGHPLAVRPDPPSPAQRAQVQVQQPPRANVPLIQESVTEEAKAAKAKVEQESATRQARDRAAGMSAVIEEVKQQVQESATAGQRVEPRPKKQAPVLRPAGGPEQPPGDGDDDDPDEPGTPPPEEEDKTESEHSGDDQPAQVPGGDGPVNAGDQQAPQPPAQPPAPAPVQAPAPAPAQPGLDDPGMNAYVQLSLMVAGAAGYAYMGPAGGVVALVGNQVAAPVIQAAFPNVPFWHFFNLPHQLQLPAMHAAMNVNVPFVAPAPGLVQQIAGVVAPPLIRAAYAGVGYVPYVAVWNPYVLLGGLTIGAITGYAVYHNMYSHPIHIYDRQRAALERTVLMLEEAQDDMFNRQVQNNQTEPSGVIEHLSAKSKITLLGLLEEVGIAHSEHTDIGMMSKEKLLALAVHTIDPTHSRTATQEVSLRRVFEIFALNEPNRNAGLSIPDLRYQLDVFNNDPQTTNHQRQQMLSEFLGEYDIYNYNTKQLARYLGIKKDKDWEKETLQYMINTIDMYSPDMQTHESALATVMYRAFDLTSTKMLMPAKGEEMTKFRMFKMYQTQHMGQETRTKYFKRHREDAELTFKRDALNFVTGAQLRGRMQHEMIPFVQIAVRKQWMYGLVTYPTIIEFRDENPITELHWMTEKITTDLYEAIYVMQDQKSMSLMKQEYIAPTQLQDEVTAKDKAFENMMAYYRAKAAYVYVPKVIEMPEQWQQIMARELEVREKNMKMGEVELQRILKQKTNLVSALMLLPEEKNEIAGRIVEIQKEIEQQAADIAPAASFYNAYAIIDFDSDKTYIFFVPPIQPDPEKQKHQTLELGERDLLFMTEDDAMKLRNRSKGFYMDTDVISGRKFHMYINPRGSGYKALVRITDYESLKNMQESKFRKAHLNPLYADDPQRLVDGLKILKARDINEFMHLEKAAQFTFMDSLQRPYSMQFFESDKASRAPSLPDLQLFQEEIKTTQQFTDIMQRHQTALHKKILNLAYTDPDKKNKRMYDNFSRIMSALYTVVLQAGPQSQNAYVSMMQKLEEGSKPMNEVIKDFTHPPGDDESQIIDEVLQGRVRGPNNQVIHLNETIGKLMSLYEGSDYLVGVLQAVNNELEQYNYAMVQYPSELVNVQTALTSLMKLKKEMTDAQVIALDGVLTDFRGTLTPEYFLDFAVNGNMPVEIGYLSPVAGMGMLADRFKSATVQIEEFEKFFHFDMQSYRKSQTVLTNYLQIIVPLTYSQQYLGGFEESIINQKSFMNMMALTAQSEHESKLNLIQRNRNIMFGVKNLSYDQVHKHIVDVFQLLETSHANLIKDEKDNIGTPVQRFAMFETHWLSPLNVVRLIQGIPLTPDSEAAIIKNMYLMAMHPKNSNLLRQAKVTKEELQSVQRLKHEQYGREHFDFINLYTRTLVISEAEEMQTLLQMADKKSQQAIEQLNAALVSNLDPSHMTLREYETFTLENIDQVPYYAGARKRYVTSDGMLNQKETQKQGLLFATGFDVPITRDETFKKMQVSSVDVQTLALQLYQNNKGNKSFNPPLFQQLEHLVHLHSASMHGGEQISVIQKGFADEVDVDGLGKLFEEFGFTADMFPEGIHPSTIGAFINLMSYGAMPLTKQSATGYTAAQVGCHLLNMARKRQLGGDFGFNVDMFRSKNMEVVEPTKEEVDDFVNITQIQNQYLECLDIMLAGDQQQHTLLQSYFNNKGQIVPDNTKNADYINSAYKRELIYQLTTHILPDIKYKVITEMAPRVSAILKQLGGKFKSKSGATFDEMPEFGFVMPMMVGMLGKYHQINPAFRDKIWHGTAKEDLDGIRRTIADLDGYKEQKKTLEETVQAQLDMFVTSQANMRHSGIEYAAFKQMSNEQQQELSPVIGLFAADADTAQYRMQQAQIALDGLQRDNIHLQGLNEKALKTQENFLKRIVERPATTTGEDIMIWLQTIKEGIKEGGKYHVYNLFRVRELESFASKIDEFRNKFMQKHTQNQMEAIQNHITGAYFGMSYTDPINQITTPLMAMLSEYMTDALANMEQAMMGTAQINSSRMTKLRSIADPVLKILGISIPEKLKQELVLPMVEQLFGQESSKAAMARVARGATLVQLANDPAVGIAQFLVQQLNKVEDNTMGILALNKFRKNLSMKKSTFDRPFLGMYALHKKHSRTLPTLRQQDGMFILKNMGFLEPGINEVNHMRSLLEAAYTTGLEYVNTGSFKDMSDADLQKFSSAHKKYMEANDMFLGQEKYKLSQEWKHATSQGTFFMDKQNKRAFLLYQPKGQKTGNKSSAPRKPYDETFRDNKKDGKQQGKGDRGDDNKYDNDKKEEKAKKTNEEFYNKGRKGGKQGYYNYKFKYDTLNKFKGAQNAFYRNAMLRKRMEGNEGMKQKLAKRRLTNKKKKKKKKKVVRDDEEEMDQDVAPNEPRDLSSIRAELGVKRDTAATETLLRMMRRVGFINQ